jgi:hypothetical protein
MKSFATKTSEAGKDAPVNDYDNTLIEIRGSYEGECYVTVVEFTAGADRALIDERAAADQRMVDWANAFELNGIKHNGEPMWQAPLIAIVHYRAPVKGDDHVALCIGKWVSWNTLDWAAVTCPHCKAREAKFKEHEAAMLREFHERGQRAARGRFFDNPVAVAKRLDATDAQRAQWLAGYGTAAEADRRTGADR